MKKDKLYLILFLGIIAISGAVIYSVGGGQSSEFVDSGVSDERSQETINLINRIEQLKKQLQDDPQNFNILAQLGNSYYDLNNPKESIKYYEEALKIRPGSPEVIVDCGVMYRKLGQPDRALEMFSQAVKLAPNLPQAFFNMGAVLLSEKSDPRGAIEIWQEFLGKNPGIDPKMREFFEDRIQQARQMELIPHTDTTR